MNLSLLLPTALAALAALALPLLIHLARRSEDKRTVFAALRWLREKPEPRRRLRFDEWPLLVARLLLLALLAVFLARPVLSGLAAGKPWIVALPGVPVHEIRGIAGDGKAELHWLAPGFPGIGAKPGTGNAQFPSLLRELDSKLPAGTRLTVVVPEQLAGADAQHVVLSRGVEWKIVPGALPEAKAADVPLQLDLSQVPVDAVGLKYLRAINAAWKPERSGQVVSIHVLPPGQASSPHVAATGQAVRGASDFQPALRDTRGDVLAETATGTSGRVLRFTRALAPATMPELLDPDFPARLRGALSPPAAPTRVHARDYAPLTGAMPYLQAPRDLKPWLGVLIALVFLVERLLATRSRRAATP